ncbi:MAG: alginate lyase family protein [Bacteroidota bacterium]|nr:alginate lyase family protein [Bacteroidota bacterium]
MTKEHGLLLIKDFILKKDSAVDGNEPYPISLRCINWVKFLSKYKIHDLEINNILYSDIVFLSKNLEFHLLGNHLLENAFSLLFGSYYFQDINLYRKSKQLIEKELNEQILNDGGHFELSPMYHQILFFRLLDSINLIKLNESWIIDDFVIFLEKKARLMCSWLKHITYQNGEIPMVNDSTYMIAPSSKNLFIYSKKIGVYSVLQPLSVSGYRKITKEKYELFVDIGNIGPDYQPGHAHSDTFNFELRLDKLPFFVDTGISTYEKNQIRKNERSTVSHNTVMVNNIEQSDAWGGFRVGRRAKILNIIENESQIAAYHNGYKNLGIIHERTFKWNNNRIEIKDSLNKPSKAKAFFHFHSSINKPRIENATLVLDDLRVNISFSNHSKIEIQTYKLSHGFNLRKSAFKVVVSFNQTLLTEIHL